MPAVKSKPDMSDDLVRRRVVRGRAVRLSTVLYHPVLRWNRDYDAEDVDGRTPLHPGSVQGLHDIVRLLLVLGRVYERDREG
jgi:hypothetical protein